MEDGRKNNGGARVGAGRKPKSEEQKLIDLLSPYDDLARECMVKGIEEGDYRFWNKFMEYRYGKPKDRVDVTTNDESLNIPNINFFRTDERN
jgi:hypothetical protein